MASGNAINNRLNSLNINGAYSLPTADGGAGSVLTTNGSGVCNWTQGGTIAQTLQVETNSVVHITGTYTVNNTVPLITGGTNLLTLNITPKSASNLLSISWQWCGSTHGGNLNAITALFYNGATAFSASSIGNGAGGNGDCYASGASFVTAGVTSASTIALRIGVDAHDLYVNGTSSGGGLFGGVCIASLTVQEIRI